MTNPPFDYGKQVQRLNQDLGSVGASLEWNTYKGMVDGLYQQIVREMEGFSHAAGTGVGALPPVWGPPGSHFMGEVPQEEQHAGLTWGQKDLLDQARYWGIQDPEKWDMQSLATEIQNRRNLVPRPHQLGAREFNLSLLGGVAGYAGETAALMSNFISNVEEKIPFVGESLAKILHTEEAKAWLQDARTQANRVVEYSLSQQPDWYTPAAQFITGAGKMAGYIFPYSGAYKVAGAVGAGIRAPAWMVVGNNPIFRTALRGGLAAATLDDPNAPTSDKAINFALGALLGGLSTRRPSQIVDMGGLRYEVPGKFYVPPGYGIAAGGALLGAGLGREVGNTPEERTRNAIVGGVLGAVVLPIVAMAPAATPIISKYFEKVRRDFRGPGDAVGPYTGPASYSDPATAPLRGKAWIVEDPTSPTSGHPTDPPYQVSANPPVGPLGSTRALPPGPEPTGGLAVETPPPAPPTDPGIAIRGEPAQVLGPDGVPRMAGSPIVTPPPGRVAGYLEPPGVATKPGVNFGSFEDIMGEYDYRQSPEFAAEYLDQPVSSEALDIMFQSAQAARYIVRGDIAIENRPPSSVTHGPARLIGSRVADAQGRPMIVYHGTGSDFEQFDPAFADQDALYGPAYYHTENPEVASTSGYTKLHDLESAQEARDQLDKLQSRLQILQTQGVDPLAHPELPPKTPEEIQSAIQNTENAIRIFSDQLQRSTATPNVRPATLDIRNPFDIDKQWSHAEVTDLLDKMQATLPEFDWGWVRNEVDDWFTQPSFTPEGMPGQSLYDMLHYAGLLLPQQGPYLDELGRYMQLSVGPETLGKALLNRTLDQIGYDGITYIGGSLMGDRPHRVWLAFRPEQVHSPWWEAVLADEEARKAASAITKQATIMESDIMPQLAGKPVTTDADVVTALKRANPGGTSIIKDVGQPIEVLQQHPDIQFVQRGDRVDALIGEFTGQQIAQYEKWGLYEGQKVVSPSGIEGDVLSISPKGMVIVRRALGGPGLKIRVENVLPSRFGDPVYMGPDLWEDFKTDLLSHINTESAKGGMAPAQNIWDPRAQDLMQGHLDDFMDRKLIEDPAARQALELYMNRRFVEEARDLDPEARDFMDQMTDLSTLEHNLRESGSDPLPVTLEELSAAKGFLFQPLPGQDGGVLRDMLNPDSTFEVHLESAQGVRQFLKDVDRAALDQTPGSTVPVEVADQLPSEGVDVQAPLVDQAGQLSSSLAEPDDFTDVVSHLRTGKGTVGAGFHPSLVHKLGANMYSGDVGVVALKEGIQNAVDAIRQAGGGDLSVIFMFDQEKNEWALNFWDTGVGMTPELMETAFVDIGGSGKESTESAGGYGLAKVALFGRSKFIQAESLTGPQGYKSKTTLTGSGDDWINGKMKLNTEVIEPGSEDDLSANGTYVKLVIPGDLVKGYQAKNWLRKFTEYSQLPGVGFKGTVYEVYGPDEFSFEESKQLKPEPIARYSVPGANITVWETEEMKEPSPWNMMDVHVLNRGVYQFTDSRGVGGSEGLPEGIVFNVEPTVDVEHQDYPFTTSREALKKAAAEKLGELAVRIKLSAGRKEIENLHQQLMSAPPIGGAEEEMSRGGFQPVKKPVVLADSPGFSQEIARRVAANRGAAILSSLADETMRLMVPNIRSRVIEQPSFGGIGVSRGWLGMNLRTRSLAKMAKENNVPTTFREDDPNQIFWNPFTTFKEVNDEIEDLAKRQPGAAIDRSVVVRRMADRLWGTMGHEIAHQAERGHDVAFAGAITRMMGDVAHLAAEWLPRAQEQIDSALDDFYNLYNEVRNEWSNAGDSKLGKIADDLADYGRLPADSEGGSLVSYERGGEDRGTPSGGGGSETPRTTGGGLVRGGETIRSMARIYAPGEGGDAGPPPWTILGEWSPWPGGRPKQLRAGETNIEAFDRLKRDNPRKWDALNEEYKHKVFRYHRYLIQNLESQLVDALGWDGVGRAWRDLEMLDTANTLASNEGHPWIAEYDDIRKAWPRQLRRDGTIFNIHQIQDFNQRMRAWYQLEDRGYDRDQIREFINASDKLADYNHRWFQFLVQDPAFAMTAEREIQQYISNVRGRSSRGVNDPWRSWGFSPYIQYFAEYSRQHGMTYAITDIDELQRIMVRAGMFKKYASAPWENYVKNWQNPGGVYAPPSIPPEIEKIMMDHANAIKFGYDPRGDAAVDAVQSIMGKVFGLKVNKREASQILAVPVSGMYMSMLAGRTSIFFRDATQPILGLSKIRVGHMTSVYRDVLSRERLQEMYQRGLKGGWITYDRPAMEGPGAFEEQAGIKEGALANLTPEEIRRREQFARIGDVVADLPAWLARPSESNISTLKWYGKQQQLHRLIVGESAYRQATADLAVFRKAEMEAVMTGNPDRMMEVMDIEYGLAFKLSRLAQGIHDPYRAFAMRSGFSSFGANETRPISKRLRELVDNNMDEEAAMMFAREVDKWVNHKFGRKEMPRAVASGWGKLGFMFGNFSGQFLEGTNDALSHGEASHKARFLATVAGMTALLYYLKEKTGWSFQRWAWPNALKFSGGPLLETATRWIAAAAGAIAMSDDRRPADFERDALIELVKPGSPYEIGLDFFPYTGYLKSAAEYSNAAQGTEPFAQAARYTITGDRGSGVGYKFREKEEVERFIRGADSAMAAYRGGIPTDTAPRADHPSGTPSQPEGFFNQLYQSIQRKLGGHPGAGGFQ